MKQRRALLDLAMHRRQLDEKGHRIAAETLLPYVREVMSADRGVR